MKTENLVILGVLGFLGMSLLKAPEPAQGQGGGGGGFSLGGIKFPSFEFPEFNIAIPGAAPSPEGPPFDIAAFLAGLQVGGEDGEKDQEIGDPFGGFKDLLSGLLAGGEDGENGQESGDPFAGFKDLFSGLLGEKDQEISGLKELLAGILDSEKDRENVFEEALDSFRKIIEEVPIPDVGPPDSEGAWWQKLLGIFDIDLGFGFSFNPDLDIDQALKGVLPGDDRSLTEKLFGMSEGENLWDLWSEQVSGWQDPAKKAWHDFWAEQGVIDERIADHWEALQEPGVDEAKLSEVDIPIISDGIPLIYPTVYGDGGGSSTPFIGSKVSPTTVYKKYLAAGASPESASSAALAAMQQGGY